MSTEIKTSSHDMQEKVNSKNSPYIIFFLMTVPVFLGTSYAAAKIGMMELAPLNLAILRFVTASLLFTIILLGMKRNNKIERIDVPRFVVLGFMAITSFFYIHFSGLQYTTSTNAGLIMATSPIFAAIFCILSGKEKVNRVAIIGIVIAFCGVSLVITQGRLEGIFQQKNLFGDILIMSNALVWAGVTIYGTIVLKKYRPFVAMAYIHIFGTVLLLPFAFFPSFFVKVPLMIQLASITWPTILSVVYLAVFCSVYSYFIWYTGVEKLGAVRTAVFNYFNPIFAVLTGIILFGEVLTTYTILGGLLVTMGVYITNNNK